MSIATPENVLIYRDLYAGVRFDMFQVINPILASNDLNLPNDRSLVNFQISGHDTLGVELNTVNCDS